jgi:hypothetical protein
MDVKEVFTVEIVGEEFAEMDLIKAIHIIRRGHKTSLRFMMVVSESMWEIDDSWAYATPGGSARFLSRSIAAISHMMSIKRKSLVRYAQRLLVSGEALSMRLYGGKRGTIGWVGQLVRSSSR